MDLNPLEEVKVENISAPKSPSDVDELNSENKLITKLNHDCLAKVLMHLSVLERLEMEKVCQKWQEATEFSWYNVKKLDFKDFVISFDKKEEIMKTIIIKCGRFLTHLKIVDYQLSYPWMHDDVLKNNCQNIIHFDIYISSINNNKIPDKDFLEIIQSMKKLKYLKVSFDHNTGPSNNFCNKIVEILPSNMTEIHLITPTTCPRRSLQVAPVLNKFNALHCLTFENFHLTKETFESLLPSKDTLSKLDLTYSKFPSGESSLFSNLINLEHLNLWMVENFDVNEIVKIVQNCPKLKSFEFHNTNRSPGMIPDPIFRELKHLNLEHLNVSEVGDLRVDGGNRIFETATNWKGLKHLNVNRGWDFSQLDLQEITKFKNLQYLHIFRVFYIDLQSFINITDNCLELREMLVNISHLPSAALGKLANLKKLERLNLSGFKNLTGDVLSKIVDNCENLVKLNLAGCVNVTEDSLIKVGKMKNLKILDISRIKNVPKEMFDYFSNNLEELFCNKCSRVNDDIVIKLIDNCLKLWFLEVYKTKITDRCLIYATERKAVFTSLTIFGDLSLTDKYSRVTPDSPPHLTICG